MRPGVSKGRVKGQGSLRMNPRRLENERMGFRIESERSQNEFRDVWELRQFLLVLLPDLHVIWYIYRFQ